MAEKILIADRIEDIIDNNEVVGKQIFNTAGDSVKVKSGQGGRLKKRWDTLLLGRAYSFTMGEFKGFPFVEDFAEVKDVFIKQAQKQVEDSISDTRNRSMAVSYSKDLVVAGKVNLGQMFEWADKFCDYIIGGEIKKDKVDKEVAPIPETEVDKEVLIEKTTPVSTIKLDFDWLKENLTTLAWKNKDVIDWLCGTFNIEPQSSLTKTIEQLSPGQVKLFINEIDGRIKIENS